MLSKYINNHCSNFFFFSVLFIIALSVFCTVILGTLYHVYQNHLQYKKRKEQETEAAILWHNGQQVQFQDPVLGPTIKVVRSRSVGII